MIRPYLPLSKRSDGPGANFGDFRPQSRSPLHRSAGDIGNQPRWCAVASSPAVSPPAEPCSKFDEREELCHVKLSTWQQPMLQRMYVGSAHTAATADHRRRAFDPVTRKARVPIVREIVANFVERFVRRPFFVR